VWQDCCHSRKHYLGATRFWSELGIDPVDFAAQLWRVSGNVTAGLRAVTLARQAAARQRPSLQRRFPFASPRCAPNRGAAPNRLRPTAMVTTWSSELLLRLDSRL